MNSKEVGDLAEAAVKFRLIEEGFIVSKPHTENCNYDFIVDNGSELKKVQVKHGHYKEGTVNADLVKSNPRATGTKRTHYKKGDVDGYMIYCSANEKVYWLPFEDAPKNSVKLRVDEPDNVVPSIRWADEYRLTENFK